MRIIALSALAALAITHPALAQSTAPSGQHMPAPYLFLAQAPLPESAPQPATQPPATGTVPRSADAVDETALRYFARRGDTARVQAEIERLRSLHPGWVPPTDLLSNEYVPDPEIIRIWELFSAQDYAGARAAIAAKRQADPAFVPSDDLLQSLALGEAGLQLRNASDARQYQTVITVAANNPKLLVCESIDNLWRLAEAFAKVNTKARAIDAYSYILTNCTNPAQRYATVQKAMELLPRADLEPLLALERTDANGQGEFADLRIGLARQSVAAWLDKSGGEPAPADIDLLEQAARTDNNADDLRLLGWYELNRERPEQARSWFESAMKADPSALSAQGLGAVLLRLGVPGAAEAALANYRNDSDALRGIYIDAAAAVLVQTPRVDLDTPVLARIVETVMSARDANVAQALGWYAYDFAQPQTAAEWFSLALRWQTDLEPAAYGLMVASNALGDRQTVESVRAQWSARSGRIAQFGRTNQSDAPPTPVPRPQHQAAAPTTPAAQTVPARPVSAASPVAPTASAGTRGCTGHVPAASLSPGAALAHGWCLMTLNRPAQAIDHFSRALQSSAETTRSDGAYGLSLAYVRMGLGDEAAVAAAAAPISQGRAIELEIAILTEKAISAYGIGDYARALDALDGRARYAPERTDLLVLRGWSYYHLRRYREAQRIFSAVAATGYGDAVSGLDAANAALRLSNPVD